MCMSVYVCGVSVCMCALACVHMWCEYVCVSECVYVCMCVSVCICGVSVCVVCVYVHAQITFGTRRQTLQFRK